MHRTWTIKVRVRVEIHEILVGWVLGKVYRGYTYTPQSHFIQPRHTDWMASTSGSNIVISWIMGIIYRMNIHAQQHSMQQSRFGSGLWHISDELMVTHTWIICLCGGRLSGAGTYLASVRAMLTVLSSPFLNMPCLPFIYKRSTDKPFIRDCSQSAIGCPLFCTCSCYFLDLPYFSILLPPPFCSWSYAGHTTSGEQALKVLCWSKHLVLCIVATKLKHLVSYRLPSYKLLDVKQAARSYPINALKMAKETDTNK